MSALEQIKVLEAQLTAAKAAAATEIQAAKAGVISEILAHMKENSVGLRDLQAYAKTASSKYSSGTSTWSGKGKQPKWLSDAIAGGKKLDDFLTNKPAVAAVTAAAPAAAA
jgi:DNA-binding protein H-NS